MSGFQLSETWGAAYLQIVVALAIFTFGVRALLLQVTLPEEVRRVVRRRRLMLGALWKMATLLTANALCFVWLLHPPRWLVPQWMDWVSGVLATVALCGTVLFWLLNMGKYSVGSVIVQLRRIVEERFSRDGNLPEDLLADMVSLGESNNPGQEKSLVLEALHGITTSVLQSGDYSGRELESLLTRVCDVAINGRRPGNDANFTLTIRLLAGVLRRCRELKIPDSVDATLSRRSLGDVFDAVIELGYDARAMTVLQLVSDAREILFRSGLQSFRSGRFRIAEAALNKLESLTLCNLTSAPQKTNNLVGLQAHFWERGGASRRRVEEFWRLFGAEFPDSLESYVRDAVPFHAKLQNYDTADTLAEWLLEASSDPPTSPDA